MPGRRLADFADQWLKKPTAIVGKGTLREFLEYLDLFREAGGVLAESGEEPDPVGGLWTEESAEEVARDAVKLMTIHAAKGLEFPTVFVLRVASGSCPSNYRETLVDFPAELRDAETEGRDDPRDLHAEEERRLFYVAVTRAEDRLYLCGKRPSKGKDPVPSKYLRELSNRKDRELKGTVAIEFLPPQDESHDVPAAPVSEDIDNLTRWLMMPPRPDARLNELSASAIEQYENCPLSFKLSRDWCIPAEPAAGMQFGAAMHLALKAYFDGVAAGRPPSEEAVIQCFLDEFAEGEDRRRPATPDVRE